MATCSRCNGTGTLDHFSHVVFNGKNGGCFHCAGTGTEPVRKPRRTRDQIQQDRKAWVQEAIEQGRRDLARMGFKVTEGR